MNPTPSGFAPTVAVWLSMQEAAHGGRVIVPLAALAEVAGVDPTSLDDALSELAALGLVSSWDPGSGAAATLTPMAAARLGLKLRRVTSGMAGLAWVALDSPDPRDRRRSRRVVNATDVGFSSLDQFAGPYPRPDEVAADAEDADRSSPRPARKLPDSALNPDRLPRPTVLLTGCAPWQRPPTGGVWHCPACKGLPLRASTLCLICDRWGLDWLLVKIRAADARTEAARSAAAESRAGQSLAERRAGVA